MNSALLFAADATILLVAGGVRGFSGFGFALVAVSALSLLHPPARVVPAVLCLEIAASAHLLPAVWRKVHWHSVAWLLGGMMFGIIPGAWFLAHASPAAMRMWVSLAVLAGALAVAREWQLPAKATHGTLAVAAGVCSGFLNASASIGGPPVILYYLATPLGAEVTRASLIAFFVAADAVSLAAMAGFGLLGREVLVVAALWLVPAVVGVHLGRRLFERGGARHYRQTVVWLLTGLALIGVGRAAWDLLPREPATRPSRNSNADQ